MSSKLKLSRFHETTKLAEEVSLLDDDEVLTLHGIEIYEDGAVYDTIDNISYNTLLEWAAAQVSAMYDPKFEKRHSPQAYEE